MIDYPNTRMLLLSGAIAALVQPAFAQTATDEVPTDDSSRDIAVAEECLVELNNVTRTMYEDEFWVTGWGGGGYGLQPAPAPVEPSAADESGDIEVPPEEMAAVPALEPMMADPRGTAAGVYSPRHQVWTLYSAAHVLAHQGNREGCEYLVARLSDTYDSYLQSLREAGVDPAAVTSWRQEQLALAEPISNVEGISSYRIDDITGTDVRNMKDEHLGSVSDVIIDPDSGSVSYVLLARGGFLGFGEDHIAIPWEQLRSTPGLETIVVDRSEAELENAPTVDPWQFRVFEDGEEREQTDRFWDDSAG